LTGSREILFLFKADGRTADGEGPAEDESDGPAGEEEPPRPATGCPVRRSPRRCVKAARNTLLP